MYMFYTWIALHYAFFSLIYSLSKIFTDATNYYRTYIYGLIHACYVSVMSLLYIYFTYFPEDKIAYYDDYYMSITFSYCIFDLVVIFSEVYKETLPNMILHHIVLAAIILFAKDTYGYFIARGLLCEISTIFLDATWLELHSENNRDVVEYYSYLTLHSFFVFRVLNFTELTIKALYLRETNYFLVMLLLTYLNMRWWYRLYLKVKS